MKLDKPSVKTLSALAALGVIFLTGHDTFESRWGDAGVIGFFLVTIIAFRVLYVTTRR